MRVTNFKKRFMMAFSLSLCVLLCGCQVLFAGEHTELIVDGEYKPFNVPRKTTEKLMELVEAEDIDYIYEVFSPAVRKQTENLSEQIQEMIQFLGKDVVSWEYNGAYGQGDQYYTYRSTDICVHKISGTYYCRMIEVTKNKNDSDTVGFSTILIAPYELLTEYPTLEQPKGIDFVYRIEDTPQTASLEPSSLEILMQSTEEGNPDDIYEMFSLTAKRESKELQGKASELAEFMRDYVTSWEPYTWAQNADTIDGAEVKTREMFFYLHTDSGLYRCDIREVLESANQEDVGFSSISIFPALYPGEEPEYEDEVYKEYCTWGQKNMGVSIVYQQEDQAD